MNTAHCSPRVIAWHAIGLTCVVNHNIFSDGDPHQMFTVAEEFKNDRVWTANISISTDVIARILDEITCHQVTISTPV